MILDILEDTIEPIDVVAEPEIQPINDSLLDNFTYFSVDAMLLRELGERLVGRPHIALAELVKNSYDADASQVLIRFKPDRIEVIDDGHGMTFFEFNQFWMRVGSSHKESLRTSRNLNRPMTGSKGVGRLSVQFLAQRLTLRTVSKEEQGRELAVAVNWDEAIQAGELTQAKAKYEEQSAQSHFAGGSSYGTALVLTSLNQKWDPDEFKALAKEIWWLQSPFKASSRTKYDDKNNFSIRLESEDAPGVVEEFEGQLRAILDIWLARLRGRVTRPESGESSVELILEFSKDSERITHTYPAPNLTPRFVEFEIRIYNLKGKQRLGIAVKEARAYFEEFGGIHVYDAGFHLPYYGPDQDWLRIEHDHAQRIWSSKLLPKEFQVSGGLRDLPTNSRIFGVVYVDTSFENQVDPSVSVASKNSDALMIENQLDPTATVTQKNNDTLTIQVTRDRLLENKAYDALVHVMRYAMDFYAMQQARRKLEEGEKIRSIVPPEVRFENVEQILQDVSETLSVPVYEALQTGVRKAIEAGTAEVKRYQQRTGLLGALATAGMSALAIEHEVQKQYSMLEAATADLRQLRINDESAQSHLQDIADKIDVWIQRSRATRSLFLHLLDDENREMQARFLVKPLLRDVIDQMRVLLRSVEIDISNLNASIRLPHGGFAEWTAIFQNVFINAVNAMLDSRQREIVVSSYQHGKMQRILVQDTGSGVDLDSADKLFEPFERRIEISKERRALGVGGTGLGLTIVRMIAENLGCTVGFVEPEEGFSTAFSLSWRES